METYLKWLGAVIILGLVFTFGMQFSARDGGVLGSVAVSNEYFATTTDSTSVGTHSLIRGSVTTLGSVVVASSSASALTVNAVKIWNATSTTDSASTTITTIRPATAEGTYTFDVVAPRGLIIQTPTGFNGSYVITWR